MKSVCNLSNYKIVLNESMKGLMPYRFFVKLSCVNYNLLSRFIWNNVCKLVLTRYKRALSSECKHALVSISRL